MCGISGILSFDNDPGRHLSRIRPMNDAMAHRGPDADGFFTEGPVAFGHRRLSIIDLSEAANQPFHEASGRYVMVFNGEMYNFMEVRRALPDYPFRTQGDTEVLIAAFAKWGPSCITRFRGMFVFAVWDRQERKLTLCRDRLGVKPLYFHGTGKGPFCFSSEVRSILASGFLKPRLDRAALTDFFATQSFPSPASPLEGIGQLEAGTWMEITEKGVSVTRYWEPHAADLPAEAFADVPAVHKKLRALLADAVSRRLVSDVPVGAFLSGGIDSSTVVGLMAEVSDARPETFNISFSEEGFDESGYAGMIARKFNTNHHEIRLRPEVMLEELEHALDALDSPSGDGINTYVVSKAIRNAGITVALSGVGGDELFAGYPFFKQYLGVMRYAPLLRAAGPLRKWAGAGAAAMSSGRFNRMAQLLRADRMDIGGCYPVFRQILSPAERSRLLGERFAGSTTIEKELAERRIGMNALPLLSQVSVAEYLGYTQQTLLKDTDQMSMAVSLEVREPFFDHDLIEYVLAIPDRLKYPHYAKQLLVESVKPMLPDEVVHRRKQGFLFPWPVWMRRELHGFCEGLLRRVSERDFVQGKELMGMWKRFLDNDPSVRWAELWLFIVLEYWMEKHHVES